MDRWLNDFHYVPEHAADVFTPENLKWLYESYYGMTYDVDRRIGELLDLIEARGLADNTVVVFVSDHGEMLGHRGMIQKRCFYDYSVKIPMIFSFPGEWRSGRCSEAASLVDLLPTFADIAGVEPPEDLPGRSVLPGVRQEEAPTERVVFAEYHGEGVHAPCFMAVKGRQKYIYVHGHEEALYDTGDDPEELDNLLQGEGPPDERHARSANELKRTLFDEFDPDAVALKARASQKARKYIYESEM